MAAVNRGFTSVQMVHTHTNTLRHGSTTSRGRSGTWRHPPSFCVAGVALGGIHPASEPISLIYNFVTRTHNIVTPNLSHTTLSLTFFHTHTHAHNSFTSNLSHTSLSHTTLSHTTLHIHTTLEMIDPPPSPLSFLLSP